MHYPSLSADLHHEVELVVAIGKGGHDIAARDAMSHVWGYGVGLEHDAPRPAGEMKKYRRGASARASRNRRRSGELRPAAERNVGAETTIRPDVNGTT